jgi:cytokinin dehydrogenase
MFRSEAAMKTTRVRYESRRPGERAPGFARTDRRRFAKAIAGGTLAAGIDAAVRWAPAVAANAAPFHDMPPLAGRLLLDEEARKKYAQDYGLIVHERPRAVLLPGSIADVSEMVRFARRVALPIVARGHGHQPFGQAQVAGGIVIDMSSLNGVSSVDVDRIAVDAGADWRTVVRAGLNQDRTPPVLPNYLGLTVGGTLSIGGIGIGTVRHGAQVDNVLELEVVTGEGKLVTCSARERRDLFDAALAGQGHAAIIARAVLRLVPKKPMVREYVLEYADVTTLLEDERLLARDSGFDGVVSLVVPSARGWTFLLNATHQFTPPERPDDAALTAGLRPIAGPPRTRDVGYLEYMDALTEIPPGPHADLGLIVPGSKAAGFIGEMLPRLTPDDLGTANGMRVFLWKRGLFTRPLFRLPDEDTLVYVAMLRGAPRDQDDLARMLAGNRALFERARALGGTLYPFCALELSAGDWQEHYGEAARARAVAKRRYDPDQVFPA